MTSNDLIEQMQQPEFYNHPVETPIKLIQTHVSYVLLTGDYVYKLKKSVNFGFLDFSSLEKRKHFLQEELRLNQPVAPEIYLEIVTITKKGDIYQLSKELSESNYPVEYALKMRQFPQENLLIKMFETGNLKEEHLEELGKVVAKFHENTITNEYIRSFGTISQIKKSIDDNYKSTEKYIGIVQTQQQYQETKQFTDKFFQNQTDLFIKRKETEKIRECHGDLHLKNICFWHNKIQLFDRIEFNEPFRFVDVMYDIAFTVMDLEGGGSKEFANIFLNTYIEQTGDYQGLEVLPLYLSRQAYVRAKVTSFLLDDANISNQEKENAAKVAAQYYQQAWQYTQPQQGKLILMSGLSGSGKTTVAKELARKFSAIQIRSDATRKHIAKIPLHEKGNQSIYTPSMNQKTYDYLLNLGISLTKAGYWVILDAKYDRRKLRIDAIEAAKKHQIPLKIIHCQAPLEILEKRLESRKHDISDATSDLLQKQIKTAETFSPRETPYVIPVDTHEPKIENGNYNKLRETLLKGF